MSGSMSTAEGTSAEEDNLTNHVIDWSIAGDDSSQSEKPSVNECASDMSDLSLGADTSNPDHQSCLSEAIDKKIQQHVLGMTHASSDAGVLNDQIVNSSSFNTSAINPVFCSVESSAQQEATTADLIQNNNDNPVYKAVDSKVSSPGFSTLQSEVIDLSRNKPIDCEVNNEINESVQSSSNLSKLEACVSNLGAPNVFLLDKNTVPIGQTDKPDQSNISMNKNMSFPISCSNNADAVRVASSDLQENVGLVGAADTTTGSSSKSEEMSQVDASQNDNQLPLIAESNPNQDEKEDVVLGSVQCYPELDTSSIEDSSAAVSEQSQDDIQTKVSQSEPCSASKGIDEQLFINPRELNTNKINMNLQKLRDKIKKIKTKKSLEEGKHQPEQSQTGQKPLVKSNEEQESSEVGGDVKSVNASTEDIVCAIDTVLKEDAVTVAGILSSVASPSQSKGASSLASTPGGIATTKESCMVASAMMLCSSPSTIVEKSDLVNKPAVDLLNDNTCQDTSVDSNVKSSADNSDLHETLVIDDKAPVSKQQDAPDPVDKVKEVSLDSNKGDVKPAAGGELLSLDVTNKSENASLNIGNIVSGGQTTQQSSSGNTDSAEVGASDSPDICVTVEDDEDDDVVVVDEVKVDEPQSPAASDHSCSTAPYGDDLVEQGTDAAALTAISSISRPTKAHHSMDQTSSQPWVATSTDQSARSHVPGSTKCAPARTMLPLNQGPLTDARHHPTGSISDPLNETAAISFLQSLGLVTKEVQDSGQHSTPQLLPSVSVSNTTPQPPRLQPSAAAPLKPVPVAKQSTPVLSPKPSTPDQLMFLTPGTPTSGGSSPSGHNWRSSPCKGFFICAFQNCNYSSNDPTEFRQHSVSLHSTGPYPCVYCRQEYHDGDSLTQHIKQHSTKKLFQTYQCTACRFSTNMKDVFKNHQNNVHKGATEYVCNHCKRSLPTVEELLQHIQQNILKLIECPYCHVKSPARSKLLAHITQAHPGQPRKISVSTSIMCKHKLTIDKTEGSLPNTPRQSPGPAPTQADANSSQKGKQRLSPTGDYLASLKVKKSKLKNESYQCLYCSYTVAEFPAFVQHVHKHTERNPHVNYYCCPYCPNVSTRKSGIVRHIPHKHRDCEKKVILRRFPLNDKSYSCRYCTDYKASSPGILHLHYMNCASRARTKADYETYQDDRLDEKGPVYIVPKGTVGTPPSSTASSPHSTPSPVSQPKPFELNVPVYEPSHIMRFFCCFCKQGYYKLASLEKHIRSVHLSSSTNKCDFNITVCPLCQFQSTEASIVKNHCTQKHWKRGSAFTVDNKVHSVILPATPAPVQRSPSLVTIDRYHCDYCNFSTSAIEALEGHMKVHDIESSSVVSSGSASQDSETGHEGSPAVLVPDERSGQVVNLPVQKSLMNCPQCHRYQTQVRSNLIIHLRHCQKSIPNQAPAVGAVATRSPISSLASPNPNQMGQRQQNQGPIDLTVTDLVDESSNSNPASDGCPLDLSTTSALDLSVKSPPSVTASDNKPYKCGYCAFSSTQKYYVQIHCSYEHSQLPEKILCTQPDLDVLESPVQVVPATSSSSPGLTLELAAVTSLAADTGSDAQSGKTDDLPTQDTASVVSGKTSSSELSQPASPQSENDKIKKGLLKLRAKVATAKVQQDQQFVDLAIVKPEPIDEVEDDLAIGTEASDVVVPTPEAKFRYQCSHCQYETKYSSEMEKHILRVHLGQNPYLCSRCGFGSFIKNKLKQHFRYKHKNVPCSLVDVRASRVVEVKRENGIVLMKAKNEQNILQAQHPYHSKSGDVPELSVDKKPEVLETAMDVGAAPKTKAKKRTFKCHHCGHSSLYNINDIKKHVIRKHLGQPVYICPRCEFGADKRAVLVKHMSRVHSAHNLTINEIIDNKVWLVTRTIEMEDENLYIVKSKEHVTVLASDPPSTPITANSTELVTKHEYACGHCEYQSDHGTNDISRHIIEHHLPIAMFTCKKCTFQCEEEAIVIEHVNVVHQGAPECYEDTKSRLVTERHVQGDVATYVTKIQDKSAQLSSPGTKKKITYCAHCKYSSPYCVTLKRHMLARHLQGKLYKCKVCNVEDNDKNRIERHMMNYHPTNLGAYIDGNSRLLMDVVTRGSQKVTQMRVANSDAELPSKESPKQSPKLAAQAVVEDNAGPKYVCGLCGKTERNKLGLLKRHIVSNHLKSSPFTCDVCSYVSNSQGTMLDHMSVSHPKTLTRFSSNLGRVKVTKQMEGGRLVYTAYTDDMQINEHTSFNMPVKKKEIVLPIENAEGLDPATLSGMARLYKCGICDYTSAACLTDVKRHVCKNHLHESTYSCNRCSFGTNKKQEMVSHLAGKHSGSVDDFSYVPAIKLTSKKQIIDGKIVYIVRMKEDGDLDDNLSLSTKEESQSVSEYFATPRKVKSVERKVSASPKGTVVTMIHCGHCEWSNKYIGDAKRHVISHHLKKLEYTCNVCETYMEAKHKMVNHIRYKHPAITNASDEIIDNKRELTTVNKGTFSIVYVTALEAEIRQFPVSEHKEDHATIPQANPQELAKAFSCGLCDYLNYSNVRDVQKHLLRTHTETKYLYECMECDFGCQVKDHMLTHFAVNHPKEEQDLFCDNSLRCIESTERRDGQDVVVVRLRDGEVYHQEDNVNKFRCGYCSYSSRFPKDVERHVENMHTNSLKCAYCKFMGRLKETVRSHCMDNHPEKPVQMKKYNAPIVRIPSSSMDGYFTLKTANSSDALSQSQGAPNSMKVKTSLPPARRQLDVVPQNKINAYRCETCDYTRVSRNEVRVHVFMVHLHYRPYKCAHCPYTAPQNTRISLHIRKQHPGKNIRAILLRNKVLEAKAENFFKSVCVFPSEITNQNVRYNMELTDKKDTSAGVYKCKYCNYKSKLMIYLRKHIKIHFTYRPFLCGYCDYGEFSKAKVYAHMRCHHSSKPQKVRSIPKPREGDLVLKNSLNSPTGGRGSPRLSVSKPAVKVSPRSNRAIRRPSRYLSPDIETASNDKYTCKICSDSYTRIHDIENHVMAHLNYKPFSCLYCSYVGITGNNVMEHTQREHPKEKVTYRYERDDEFDRKMTQSIEYPTNKRKWEETVDDYEDTVVQKKPKFDQTEKTSVNEDGTYKCPYCSLMMDGVVTVKRHMMKHHGYKPFECSRCSFSYYLTSAVKKHHRERHGKYPTVRVNINADLDFKVMSDVYAICGSLGKCNRLLSYQDVCVQPDVSCCPVYTTDMFTTGYALHTVSAPSTEHTEPVLATEPTEPETELEPEPEPGTEPEPDTEAEAELETEAETEVETEPEAELETEPEAEVETEPEPELETEPEPEPEVELKTEPETEGETELELDIKKEATEDGAFDIVKDVVADVEVQEKVEMKTEVKSIVTRNTGLLSSPAPTTEELHCTLCEFTCPRRRAMKYHLMKHKKYQPYICPHCSKRSAFDLCLKKHMKDSHPGSKSKKFIVRRVKKIDNWIDNELEKIAGTSKTIIAGGKQLQMDPGSTSLLIKCFYCEYITHKLTALKLHFTKSHRTKKLRKVEISNPLKPSEESSGSEFTEKPVATKSLQRPPGLMKCIYCPYTNHVTKFIKIHHSRSHPGKLFQTVDVPTEDEDEDMRPLKRKASDDGGGLSKVPRLDGPYPPVGDDQPLTTLKCSYCSFNAINSWSLKVHTRRAHGLVLNTTKSPEASKQAAPKKVKAYMKGSKRWFKCTACTFTKNSVTPVMRHYARRHEYYNQTVMCGHCGQTGHESYDIKVHNSRFHHGMELKVIRLSTPLPRTDRKKKMQNITPDCSSRETSEEKSSRESSEDKAIPDIKCEPTDTVPTPSTSENLIELSFFNCDKCEFYALTEDELANHIAHHQLGQQKVFSCDLCEFTSEVKSEYNCHVKTHTERTPFQCGHCNYTAFFRHSVQQHCKKRHPHLTMMAVELPHPFTSVGKPQPSLQPELKVPKYAQM